MMRNSSSRLISAILTLSMASVGTVIYLSPLGSHIRSGLPGVKIPGLFGHSSTESSSGSTRALSGGDRGSTKSSRSVDKRRASSTIKIKSDTRARRGSVVEATGGGSPAISTGPATHYLPVVHRLTECWQFKWQQDAQKVYLANLSDPYGLDGDPGPYNGDGIACAGLKVDRSRPRSTPVGAYEPPSPSTATKAQLVSPSHDYFGVAQDGIPGDGKMLDTLDRQAGKAPSAIEWFSGWDSDYRGDLVHSAWRRGALPVMTWMSKATLPGSTEPDSAYSLNQIISGTWDKYLTKYAGQIVRTNLPVVIRFDHEMNGNTYPWSSGMYNNTPQKYIEAWRHVWNIFESVGANDNVIWLWAPNRPDKLVIRAGNGNTPLADSYPGDAYVDWVGTSAYLRYSDQGSTFDGTFGKSINALQAVTSKPIFFPEIAATQSLNGTDLTTLKAEWITNVLGAFAANPDIVGFCWFNNQATHVVDGQDVAYDWRFQSSEASRLAFKAAVGNDAFASGTKPDS
jgi:mannan endo-1,4-beta-mannosidase